MGYLKGKSRLMIYDKHPELQSKWDKTFWARGYYVLTIDNITEELRKEDTRPPFYRELVTMFAIPTFLGERVTAPYRDDSNHYLKWWL